MPRRLVALSLPVLALFAVAARKPDHPKHENHYKAVSTPAVDGLTISLDRSESQQEFLKLAATLTNTTADRLFLVPADKGTFVTAAGELASKGPSIFGKALVLIPPGDKKGLSWSVDGRSDLHVDTFTFRTAGVLSAPNAGATITAPEFQLMPSKNDFTAGAFSCNLTDHNYKTDFSIAAFTCVYNGTGVGFIDARKISARSKSGTMYANLNKKAKRDVVLPGDKAKFETNIVIPASDADMQFVPYNLVFGDAFSEAATTPVVVPDWKFDIDAAKTLDANK